LCIAVCIAKRLASNLRFARGPSKIDARAEITSYKPSRYRSPAARLDYFRIADDTVVITWRLDLIPDISE